MINEIISFIFLIKVEYKSTKNIFKKLFLKYKLFIIKNNIKKMRNIILSKDIITEFIIAYNNFNGYNNIEIIDVKITNHIFVLTISIDDIVTKVSTTDVDDKIVILYNNKNVIGSIIRVELIDSLLPIKYKDESNKYKLIENTNYVVREFIIDFLFNIIKKESD